MTEQQTVRVGVVGGTRLPGNVESFLANVRKLLEDHQTTFQLDLVIRDDVDAPDGYRVVDPGFGKPDRAVTTLRTLADGLTRYADEHPVDVLFQVTKFPLHGCATTIASHRTDTPVLTRFAGDNFREHHFSTGVDRARAFVLNNVFGQVPVRWSDRVIVLGSHGRSEIQRRNAEVDIETIPQPIDRGQFSPVSSARETKLVRELGFSPDKRTFLTVGRLSERKGMIDIVRSARRLAEKDYPFEWYVIGDGALFERLESTPGVHPLGRVDFSAIPDYYRGADLVVHPSLIEGLPNVLLEAAACGTPSVTRDVGDSELVASATFDDTDRLPDLLTVDHEPVDLGPRFTPDNLRNRYAQALIETAKGKL